MTDKKTYRRLILKSRISSVILFFLITTPSFSQSHFLDSLLKAGLSGYTELLSRPSSYKLQIAYTRIDRDKENVPHFSHFYYRPDKEYIYPASTVKLPVSILTLSKLQELNVKGLERSTTMISDSAFSCRQAVRSDSSSSNGLPTLENYIKRMLLVSDNSAFARTYDFVGFEDAHKELAAAGFPNARLLNRLEQSCAIDSLPSTPPVCFLNAAGDTLYKQKAELVSKRFPHPRKNSSAGIYHREGKHWIKGPKDFSMHNYLSLSDLHLMMEKLVFNNFLPKDERLNLEEEDRLFLLKQLGSWPRESDHPAYNPKVFYDSYKKYFIYGAAVATIQQDSLRVINIVGRAYGFLIDCAYIVDLKNNLEFLLTCAIYVNKNGRIGSGKYEYDKIGLPFMKDLSLAVYNYERRRERKFVPELEEFSRMFK